MVGVGTVQHFAFAVDSAEEQEAWRDYLRERGVEATDVFERGGFRAIYLRDPDNHIVEIATRADVGRAVEAAGLPTEPGAASDTSPEVPLSDGCCRRSEARVDLYVDATLCDAHGRQQDRQRAALAVGE